MGGGKTMIILGIIVGGAIIFAAGCLVHPRGRCVG